MTNNDVQDRHWLIRWPVPTDTHLGEFTSVFNVKWMKSSGMCTTVLFAVDLWGCKHLFYRENKNNWENDLFGWSSVSMGPQNVCIPSGVNKPDWASWGSNRCNLWGSWGPACPGAPGSSAWWMFSPSQSWRRPCDVAPAETPSAVGRHCTSVNEVNKMLVCTENCLFLSLCATWRV